VLKLRDQKIAQAVGNVFFFFFFSFRYISSKHTDCLIIKND
jgi:hypothetical protein